MGLSVLQCLAPWWPCSMALCTLPLAALLVVQLLPWQPQTSQPGWGHSWAPSLCSPCCVQSPPPVAFLTFVPSISLPDPLQWSWADWMAITVALIFSWLALNMAVSLNWPLSRYSIVSMTLLLHWIPSIPPLTWVAHVSDSTVGLGWKFIFWHWLPFFTNDCNWLEVFRVTQSLKLLLVRLFILCHQHYIITDCLRCFFISRWCTAELTSIFTVVAGRDLSFCHLVKWTFFQYVCCPHISKLLGAGCHVIVSYPRRP